MALEIHDTLNGKLVAVYVYGNIFKIYFLVEAEFSGNISFYFSLPSPSSPQSSTLLIVHLYVCNKAALPPLPSQTWW